MKSYTWRNFWFLIVVFVVLTFCQSKSEQQLIAYTSNAQAWVMRPDGTQANLAVKLDFATSGLKWSSDGTQMAFIVTTVPDRKSIWIANSDGSEPRQVSEEFDSIRATWLNNDILITHVITEEHQSGVSSFANYTLDLRSGTMRVYSQGPEDVISLPSGDRWIANNGLLGWMLYDPEGSAWTLLPRFMPGPHAFDVSPLDREIVFCNNWLVTIKGMPRGLYKAVIEGNGINEPSLVYPIDDCICVHWSPNGKYIALLDNQDKFYILDATTFSLIRVFDIGPLVTSVFRWSPDSKYVLMHRHYGKPGLAPKEVARVSIEDGEIVRLTENESVELITDWVSLPLR